MQDFSDWFIQGMENHTCGYEHDDTVTCEEAEEHWEREYAAEAAAEMAAEMAVERYYEDRGYWEHVAHDEWEAARGVIPFHVAAEMAAEAARKA